MTKQWKENVIFICISGESMEKYKNWTKIVIPTRLSLQITIHSVIFKAFGGKFNKNILECLKIVFHYLFILVSYIKY